jgi:hypothetical protein
MVHDELEKSMLSPPVWTARQRQYFVVCRAAKHRVGLVTEITRRCRWRFWISPRSASSMGAHCRHLNGAQCSATRWSLSTLHLDSHVAGAAIMVSVLLVNLLGDGIRRAINAGAIMPLLDIRNLTIEFKTGEGWVKAVDRISITLQVKFAVWWVNPAPEKPDRQSHLRRGERQLARHR